MEDGAKRSGIEAKGYFKALMRVLPYRVILLLAWHEEFYTGIVVDDLRRLGKKVADYISDERFAYYRDITLDDGKHKIELGPTLDLYDHAKSMAMDMGLFLAVMLLQLDHPDIGWDMLMQGKRNVDYHQALVTGPNQEVFEPVWQSAGFGLSIAEGKRSSNIWAEYYLRWVDIIEGREPRSLQYV